MSPINLTHLHCPLLLLNVKQHLLSQVANTEICFKIKGKAALGDVKYFLVKKNYLFQIEQESLSFFNVRVLSKKDSNG